MYVPSLTFIVDNCEIGAFPDLTGAKFGTFKNTS